MIILVNWRRITAKIIAKPWVALAAFAMWLILH